LTFSTNGSCGCTERLVTLSVVNIRLSGTHRNTSGKRKYEVNLAGL